ncbi:MAG TPA: methylmalonyl-CoA mutase family protein [Gaiella sp.]|uniref:acyl-CoA mutase large subunit family protein n=1 Tax=Gaiella sp. TaxID=2663207 RepID=UPI002D7E9718|nr:methylmalonyl-CoA mutase family protein [Gaiella sp.]HET9286292.1 methylmalonyl-CoA mutase family protein [Gaiella sp.]
MARVEERRISGLDAWRSRYAAVPLRDGEVFTSISGAEVDPLATPESVSLDYERDLGYPGSFPFTRGVYPSMYRGRLWTMRQFAGFGTAQETNERFRYLLEHGQTGLSCAFDMPALMGVDSDSPRAMGEVGREGVAVASLEDMRVLFSGIPLGEVSTSMTINSSAAIALAMYLVVGEEQDVPRERLRGTIQTDILKEYIAQKEFIFPPGPSMRLVTDMVEFCAAEMPLWHPISISGYHIREAGSTAAQELAFTLKNGFTYVEWALERGLDVDSFAPRLSFFFNAHLDFFEEIAKYRAARRIWAREMRDTYGARDERSLLMRFHTQTAGVSLTWQQPLVNVARTAIEALAAVLGGTQSLHTNSYDEALALPTEDAVRLALRTQQVIAHETGVVNSIDPLGGSYHVEALTNRLEEEAYELFRRIDELGGMVAAIEQNMPQREIAEAAYRYQQEVEADERIVVGVNRYQSTDADEIHILRIDPDLERKQIERLQAFKAGRDSAVVERRIAELAEAAAVPDRNLMPVIVEAVRDGVTLGEICDTWRAVWGTWREQPVF